MALVNKPDESIFASSAKQGEVDNFPDLLRGWGITFDQTQGIPPMEWFNFLFKRLDEKHAYLMQRGLPEWSATQDYNKGSCVQFDGLSYRALKANQNNQPNEANSQYWVRWGFTLTEIARATLTQYGLTQLYTGYDSQREDLALTPKTAFLLKQLIDSNTRILGDVIPNSKKSDEVNSNSSDTVATSKAVKTAYDKGVEAKTAADNAQHTANSAENIANNANDNANGRVSKIGDTMTGQLSVPNIITKHHGTGGYHNQFDMQAPFFVDAVGYTRQSTFHPFIKGKVRTKGDWGAVFSIGYTTKQTGYYENGEFGRGVINLNEDNGTFKNWEFEHSGTFRSAGDVVTSTGRSLNSTIYKEGNPHDIALSWLTDGLKVRVDTTDLGRVVFRHDFQYQKIGNFEIRRYPDGTMIQTYIIYQYDLKDLNDEKSFNWAQAFIDTPVVMPFITTEVNDGHDCGVNILTKSNHATVFYREYEHGHPDQGNVRIQFYAIGRWK